MLAATLSAYRTATHTSKIKVIRLRIFAGMPQGIVVGDGEEVRQFAFNAQTGSRVSFYEPGYPVTGQTFGWQVDETAKQIHRGDFLGITGRWISLMCGFALLYLGCSAAFLYWEIWK